MVEVELLVVVLDVEVDWVVEVELDVVVELVEVDWVVEVELEVVVELVEVDIEVVVEVVVPALTVTSTNILEAPTTPVEVITLLSICLSSVKVKAELICWLAPVTVEEVISVSNVPGVADSLVSLVESAALVAS